MFYDGDIKNKKILLHACCGPCSLGAVEPLLSDGADITLYFYNPCITDGEFDRRLEAIEIVADHYGLELIVPRHDYAEYLEYARPLGGEREGGARCGLCFRDRLENAAKYADENGFDMYSTTLTVSPHKNAKAIFDIGGGFDFGAPMLARDFKKRDGFARSTALSRALGIYRQNFCGCEFSFRAEPKAGAGRAEA